MAAVFPETMVKQPNGNYKAYYRHSNGEVDEVEMTPEELSKMVAFSIERFGRPPNTKVIG